MDAIGIEALTMMKKWNVTYDKYKNKLHYGCLKHYYSKFGRPHPQAPLHFVPLVEVALFLC